MIKSAAILRSDGVVIEGRDHAECIQNSPEGTCRSGSTQGFVTTEGKFIDRVEAGRIAWAAGQILNDPKGGVIFSEEIWSQGPMRWDEKTKSYIWRRK